MIFVSLRFLDYLWRANMLTLMLTTGGNATPYLPLHGFFTSA